MKKILISLMLLAITSISYAGIQDGILIRKGLSNTVKVVSVSSSTCALAITFDTRRIDFIIRHSNTSYDVLVASDATASAGRTNGFPIKAGETFSPDGYYPGEMYLIMPEFGTTTNVNIIEFYRQEY